MHVKMLAKGNRDQEQFYDPPPFLEKLKEAYPGVHPSHSTWDANDKFSTICDLIKLYAVTNTKVLEDVDKRSIMT